jgi:hypothetical protein
MKKKSTDNSRKKNKKNHKKIKRTKWGNTVAIHSVFFKKNYKAKFSTSTI